MNFVGRILLIVLMSLFLIVGPSVVLAGTEEAIFIGENEIVDGNFVRFGSVIDIKGPVNGDVVVAGSTITISGPVAGDVIAVGATIRITGDVEGSVRVAGSAVEVSGNVKRNVWAIGSTILIGENSSVGWDVLAGAADVEVKGKILGNARLAGANLILANEIGKNVNLEIDDQGQAILLPGAKVAGELKYQSKNEDQLTINDGAEIIGETKYIGYDYLPKSDLAKFFGVSYVIYRLITFFGLIVVGLVLVTLVPKLVLRIDEAMMKKAGLSIGWGSVFLIITPALVIFLIFTVIGIPLAIILIPLYLIILYVSNVFVGLRAGFYLFSNFNKKKTYKGSLVWPLVIGLFVVGVITSIPIFGWVLKLVGMLWAAGAILSIKKDLIKEYK